MNKGKVVDPEMYDGYASPAQRPRGGHGRMPSYLTAGSGSASPLAGFNGANSVVGVCSSTGTSIDGTGIGSPSSMSRTASTETAASSPNDNAPNRSTTIIWAHACLRGKFIPSQTYIPPDPLLPLRSALLHQPLGSGNFSSSLTSSSLDPYSSSSSSSSWITFGSGTIGQESLPSLTGSLLGLAKGLVNTGVGQQSGSLEEERKRIWNSKELPVLETVRCLVDVMQEVKDGEKVSCELRRLH